ncbi:MAG: transglutaminase domain-containing protein [Alphaproteobacteria bacterium]|jgi:transglutaminase-like putative cysteine protease|nr:transglutaminase domain-containing protein [Alphaproteobacteria bacterium]MBT4019779.1 transglutaminase domain-containing protein [Alphaproteobacteria bacterium]MBT4965487.1 transglutaminase domain-containing protein [Alphaproteobacteria bacterium]MBT5158586.1 transglutaminase domain-containing protein [Alphaproteobacteria bacterium]MBT5917578.1 transglutaminase domain-containing protein [Alphaproteobacteria bacterium]
MNTTNYSDDVAEFLKPTSSIESDNAAIIAWAKEKAGDATSDIDIAVNLYYAVRDEFKYDPYDFTLDHEGLSASGCLARGKGFCVPKAALLAACCRSLGIPARVGYADVRNHMTSKRLTEAMGTDLFVYHGYSEIYLEGKWVKATPVFNKSLCEKARVLPMEFDGRNDSVFHPMNADGERHMEYVHDHGPFADVPIDDIATSFRELYPNLTGGKVSGGDFEADAATNNS